MRGTWRRKWERKGIAISQLEQDSHGNKRTTKMESEVSKFTDSTPQLDGT